MPTLDELMQNVGVSYDVIQYERFYEAVITLVRVMLINPDYDCDYVFDMILSVIYMNICGFEFLSVHRRKICLIICFRI